MICNFQKCFWEAFSLDVNMSLQTTLWAWVAR